MFATSVRIFVRGSLGWSLCAHLVGLGWAVSALDDENNDMVA